MKKSCYREFKMFKEIFSVNFLRIIFLMIAASILTYMIFPKYHYINDIHRFNRTSGHIEELGEYKGKIRWVSFQQLEKEDAKRKAQDKLDFLK